MKQIILGIFISWVVLLFWSCNSQHLTCSSFTKGNYLQNDLKSKEDTIAFVSKLTKLLDNTPNCIKALQVRGFLLMAQSKFELAKIDFSKALKVDSLSPYTLYYLSMLYNFENKNDISIFLLDRAIQAKTKDGYVIDRNNMVFNNLDVEFGQLVHFRGIINFDRGQMENAKRDFMICVTNHYRFDDTFAYLAAIYNNQKNIDSACYFHLKSVATGYDGMLDSSLLQRCGNVGNGKVSE